MEAPTQAGPRREGTEKKHDIPVTSFVLLTECNRKLGHQGSPSHRICGVSFPSIKQGKKSKELKGRTGNNQYKGKQKLDF